MFKNERLLPNAVWVLFFIFCFAILTFALIGVHNWASVIFYNANFTDFIKVVIAITATVTLSVLTFCIAIKIILKKSSLPDRIIQLKEAILEFDFSFIAAFCIVLLIGLFYFFATTNLISSKLTVNEVIKSAEDLNKKIAANAVLEVPVGDGSTRLVTEEFNEHVYDLDKLTLSAAIVYPIKKTAGLYNSIAVAHEIKGDLKKAKKGK